LLPQSEMTAAKLAVLLTGIGRDALLQRAQAAKQMQQTQATAAVVAACEELTV
jgi:UDP-N-acetylglucosamine--N-acetylmuramyl-(pentapeptide) pyrophosphoryl-undecaprenol N-acetylglucosamine transferase